jgi:hypothetical protein
MILDVAQSPKTALPNETPVPFVAGSAAKIA